MIEADVAEPPSIDVQFAAFDESVPGSEDLRKWAATALCNKNAELTLRIVGVDEIQQLNHQYRSQNKPTNVLSFPSELPVELDLPLIGDVIVCAEVVNREALAQSKQADAHWAHMVIHGVLHLQGYDHIDPQDADRMESEEIRLLAQLGYSNPYESNSDAE